MSNATDAAKRARLLDAARNVFARYGFKRASMADIAAEAGVSRPALYLWFRSKQDVLRSLAEQLRDLALAGAESGWRDGAAFPANLEATILGKELELFRLLHASPHGAEILAADETLTAEISRDLDRRFRALLARRFRDAAAAGTIDLAAADGDADALAVIVHTSVKAAMQEAEDEDDFVIAVRRLARLMAAAVCAA
ncbi:MAG: helix-turn-helix domain-containing protein [Alphaproteobacteria bacterium]|nr:helix-turn-helix domain-containing protein [Alphaproteobacteria bacterium]